MADHYFAERIMLNAVKLGVNYFINYYAECCYVECHYGECSGALALRPNSTLV
jgi:hypothetical protein